MREIFKEIHLEFLALSMKLLQLYLCFKRNYWSKIEIIIFKLKKVCFILINI